MWARDRRPGRLTSSCRPASCCLVWWISRSTAISALTCRQRGRTGWAQVVTRLPETGTTAFLPTFITAPIDELSAALRGAVGLVPALALTGGARVLGVHVEGPFIAPDRRGAHNEAWITAASPAAVTDLLEAGRGLLKMVTLAPERDGGMAAIDQFTQAGVLVSVGHSDATARQVASAVDRGARMVTHLFDGQRPLHHREPGWSARRWPIGG